ncbi:MAG: class I SAM-dependent methyltransferase [Anaeromyxobacter sp.]
MPDHAACVCCGAAALAPLGPVGLRPGSVLSDSRPCAIPARVEVCEVCGHLQKRHDEADRRAIAALYADYRAHHLSRGNEQPAFAAGGAPMPRTQVALERILPRLPARGRLLDFGCGNGAALRSASRLLPGWELHGADLDAQHREEVLAIPGVARFHPGAVIPADAAAGGFDLVVLWHVAEHLTAPVEVLRSVGGLLAPDGLVLVSVPDVQRTVFDLAVLDHVSHFSVAGLGRVLGRAGYAVVEDGQAWLHNCATLLCRRGAGGPEPRLLPPGDGAWPEGRGCVEALRSVTERFEACAARGPYALFGVGMASLWLLGQLSRAPACLVDEDPARQGQRVGGIPVVAPAQLPAGLDLLLPFAPPTARALAARLGPGLPGRALVGPEG